MPLDEKLTAEELQCVVDNFQAFFQDLSFYKIRVAGKLRDEGPHKLVFSWPPTHQVEVPVYKDFLFDTRLYDRTLVILYINGLPPPPRTALQRLLQEDIV